MATLESGSRAPEFQLTGLKGEAIALSAYHGSPVLLLFFNSTCPWCQVEMARLGEVCQRHTDTDVQVFGVVIGEDDNVTVEKFVSEMKLGFPVAMDLDKQVRQAYSLERVPTIMLVDSNGNVARVYEGSTEQLSGIVEQTILAAARRERLPDYHLVGNGCSPD